jgi:cytochrome c peroxidase
MNRPAYAITGLAACLAACAKPPSPPPAPVAPVTAPAPPVPDTLDAWQAVGKAIFFDANLSVPAGQSCASCHAPETAFSDPLHRALSPGAMAGRASRRNAPTLTYAAHIPVAGLTADDDALPPAPENDPHAQEVREENLPLIRAGGLFLDGRADTLEAQIHGPWFNPLEMNNPDAADLAKRLSAAPYAAQLEALAGPEAMATPQAVLQAAASAVAAFERGAAFSPFASRYDRFLAGQAPLTPQEREGLEVFENPKLGNCAACHPNRPLPYDTTAPLLTDHTVHNLGWSRQGDAPPDQGLKEATGKAEDAGKFRTPTLRNLGKTAPYFHDGRFKDLREVVDFYADRDTPEGAKRFGAPAFAPTMETRRMGKLPLTPAQREALVAFLKTLDDE